MMKYLLTILLLTLLTAPAYARVTYEYDFMTDSTVWTVEYPGNTTLSDSLCTYWSTGGYTGLNGLEFRHTGTGLEEIYRDISLPLGDSTWYSDSYTRVRSIRFNITFDIHSGWHAAAAFFKIDNNALGLSFTPVYQTDVFDAAEEWVIKGQYIGIEKSITLYSPSDTHSVSPYDGNRLADLMRNTAHIVLRGTNGVYSPPAWIVFTISYYIEYERYGGLPPYSGENGYIIKRLLLQERP